MVLNLNIVTAELLSVPNCIKRKHNIEDVVATTRHKVQ